MSDTHSPQTMQRPPANLSPDCLTIDDAELTHRVQMAFDESGTTERGTAVACWGPTYVALRRGGMLKQSYWRYDLDLDQVVVQVVDGAIARISELGSDQSIDTIELGFTHNYRTVPSSQFDQTFSNIYRGLRGIELQYKDQLVRYSPTRMIAANLSFRKILDQFLQHQGISFKTFTRRGGVIQAFDTRQVLVFLTPTITAVTLHRGNRVVPMASLSGTVLEDLTTQMGQWLQRQVQADGRMVYKYFPSRGTESEANNLIRQFMATLALIRYAQATAQPHHWTLAQHNLNYTLRQFYRSENRSGEELGWVEYDGKVKLGAIALAALAILEFSDGLASRDHGSSQPKTWTVAPAYQTQFQGFCATIDTLWQSDGSFRTFFKPADRNDNQNFYPGEALLFWANLYQRTQDSVILERCYTSFAYYRTWHREHYNPAFIPWHTQAYALLYQETGDTGFAQASQRQFLDAIMEMNDGLVAMQQWFPDETTIHADVRGRFYQPDANYGPPHASSTGVYLEGLADAYALALQTGDRERAEIYEAVIWRGLRSVRQLQFRDGVDLFYVSNRAAVQGGLRTTVYDNVIRVDNVQHCLMALLKLQRWPAFQPDATPTPRALTATALTACDAADWRTTPSNSPLPRGRTTPSNSPLARGRFGVSPLGKGGLRGVKPDFELQTEESIATQVKTKDDAHSLQHFRLIHAAVEIQPLLDEIAAHEPLWLHNTSRQDKITVQRETQSIYLRSVKKPFPPGITSSNDVHESRPTQLVEQFPQVMHWVKQFAQAQGGEVGRVAIVRLAPHGRVYRHIDHGDYYRVRDRYHLVLHSTSGSLLGAGDEWIRMHPGECWWFNNKKPHEAYNESDDWRIHLIFDILPH